MFIFSQAKAGKWYAEPSSSVRFGYEDNVRLVVDDEEGAFSSFVHIKAPIGFRTEVSEVDFTAQLDSVRYDGLSDLDTDDQSLSFFSMVHSGRDIFKLQAAYEHDSTRVNEWKTTGFVHSSKRRNSRSLMPYWRRGLTEKTSLQLNYQYNEVRYQDAAFTTLVDYRYSKATGGIVYKYSEKIDWYSNLLASKYQASDVGSVFKTYGLQAGASYQLSERLSTSFFIELSRNESRYFSSEEVVSDNVILMDFSLSRTYENSRIEGTVRTSEMPSSQGRVLRTNTMQFVFRGMLAQSIHLSFKAEVYKNYSTGGEVDSSNDRLYFFIEPGLAWRATPWWRISATYRYRNQNYTDLPQSSAESNGLFFSASYVWPKEPFQ